MFEKFISALGLGQKQEEEVTQVINLYDAVLAHKAWKRRLFEYLEGRSKENLEPSKICVDHQCVLGKWIHSDGSLANNRYSNWWMNTRNSTHAAGGGSAPGQEYRQGDEITGTFDEQSRKQ
jgi:hypothetical protein